VDLKQGLCRYRLRGEVFDMTLSVQHGSYTAPPPVRLHHAITHQRAAYDEITTDPQRLKNASRLLI